MSIPKLRKQLREAGIKDEDMFFDDAPDGGIIPRLVFRSDEVLVVEESSLPFSIPLAEKHGLSCSQDSREQSRGNLSPLGEYQQHSGQKELEQPKKQ